MSQVSCCLLPPFQHIILGCLFWIDKNERLSVVVIGDYLQLLLVKKESYFQDLPVEVRWISYYHSIYCIYLNMLNWLSLLDKVIRHLDMCWTVFALVLSMKILKAFESKIYRSIWQVIPTWCNEYVYRKCTNSIEKSNCSK